jgi:AGCS family alanine or glycine:cation symporter
MNARPEDGLLAVAGATLAQAVVRAADLAFGPWTIGLLLGTGLFLTVRFRFVQVTRFRDALRSFVPARPEGGGALSPFQAFMTALAA